jgi:hypothetical protein
MALAIVLTGLLAALRTRGWRIPAWSASAATIVFGLASVVFPDQPGAVGRGWGGLAIAGGVLFVAAAQREAKDRPRRTGFRNGPLRLRFGPLRCGEMR